MSEPRWSIYPTEWEQGDRIHTSCLCLLYMLLISAVCREQGKGEGKK